MINTIIDYLDNINLDMEKIIYKLQAGELFIIPTDTIYGLCGLANNKKAVEKIFKIKKRNLKKALTIFPENIDNISKYVKLCSTSKNLIKQFFPGNLTLVLPQNPEHEIYPEISKNQCFGIRFPKHEFCIKLLNNLNQALVVTSVNLTGEPSINKKEEILEFAKNYQINAIIDSKFSVHAPSMVMKIMYNTLQIMRYNDDKSFNKIMEKIYNYS